MSLWWRAPAPEFRRFTAGTVDEARAMYGEYGQRVTVERARIREPLTCSISVAQIGPLEISRHAIADGLTVRIDRDDLYGIGLSTTGRMTVERRTGQTITSRVRGVTTDPRSGPMVVRPFPMSRLESVVIEQWALEAHAEDLLGYPVRRGIALPGEVDLGGVDGRLLRQLLELLFESVDDPTGIIFRPIITEPLCHALLDALLLTLHHPYRADLQRPVARGIGARPLRRCVEAIHECPEQAHTSASLARLSDVSVRTLQEAFRRQLGDTPMGYLRQVRLSRAHEDLVAGKGSTVAEVAHRWGFTHLSRFACAYRAKYGTSPSVTLRNSSLG